MSGEPSSGHGSGMPGEAVVRHRAVPRLYAGALSLRAARTASGARPTGGSTSAGTLGRGVMESKEFLGVVLAPVLEAASSPAWRDSARAPSWYVNDLFTAETAHGRSVGRALIEDVYDGLERVPA